MDGGQNFHLLTFVFLRVLRGFISSAVLRNSGLRGELMTCIFSAQEIHEQANGPGVSGR